MSNSIFSTLESAALFLFTTRRIGLCFGFLSVILLTSLTKSTGIGDIQDGSQLREGLKLDPKVLNRSACCLSDDREIDICGRSNCTWPCPNPEPPLPQLDPEQTNLRRQNYGFFLETSGSGSLNYRQACAAESLAYHNPDITVFIFFIDTQINTSSPAAIHLRNHYKNVHLVSINIDDYLAGTPLEHWYHCTEWRKGPYYVEHLSDGLRVLTIAKYGGYYFDLDVIQLRPITYMRNFLITNCVIHADYGHPLMHMAAEEFPKKYQPNAWTFNGPELLDRVLQKWCQAKDGGEMSFVKCHGYYLIPVESFSPLHYSQVKEIFDERPSNETGDPGFVKDNIAGLHTYNKLSKGIPVFKNSTQYFTRLARKNCPLTFSKAPEIF